MPSWFPFPDSASTMSGEVDALYLYLCGVTAFFTLLIYAVVIYFVIRYRRRNPSEIPRPIEGSTKLETLWSVIPLLIAMTIFVWGAKVYFAQYRPAQNALEVYVVGKQWMWKFQHATGQREINELHVPLGQRVKLIMTTEDVIHDVFIPAFRVKLDVVPGKYTTEWFEATKPGRYNFFCAEYCGMNHSGMRGYIEVMEPTEYENWLSGNAAASPAAAGRGLFESLGCVSCHGANAEGGRGPALMGVFGAKVVLNNGQSVVADEGYVRESILNPQAKIVTGFGPIMPSFQGQISEEQLLQLVAYVKSLSTAKPETATEKPPPPSAKPSATPKASPSSKK
ncbi:MAG TPA: cytochrome c oxidase subunit II [Pyrinomonadaceae bacterium]|nr:cytochrome c oxidase subunit II [Pyrinomonadaceae bacterium]